jgi:hypothetical protein
LFVIPQHLLFVIPQHLLFVIPQHLLFVIPQHLLFVIPQHLLFVIPQRSGGICFFSSQHDLRHCLKCSKSSTRRRKQGQTACGKNSSFRKGTASSVP